MTDVTRLFCASAHARRATAPILGARNSLNPVSLCIFLVAIGLLASHRCARAQSLATVSGSWIPTSDLRVSPDIPELEPQDDVGVQVSIFRAGVNVPLRITQRVRLIPGLSYQLLSINQVGDSEDQALHDVSASVLLYFQATETWSFSLQAASTLAGDFAEVGTDHLRFGGSALASYTFSPRFVLGAGILVGWQFGRPLPLPAVRLQWQISYDVRLRALLPSEAELIWRLHDRVELSLWAGIRGQTYALTSERTQGRWPCAAQSADDINTEAVDEREARPQSCVTKLSYSQGEVGPKVSVRLTSSLWLSVQGTFAFFRRYEPLNDMNEVPEVGVLNLDRNVAVQAALTLRIPKT